MKPIFGCETYVAPDRLDKTDRRINHLILLAKNEVGYKNLSYLNSMGYLEGFYYNPRIDKELLREHSRGADRAVGVPRRRGRADAHARAGPRRRRARRASTQDIFGPGNFFLELQPNGLAEQETVNGHLIEMSQKTGIPLVATNDCHYVNQDDARAHEVLMCIQQARPSTTRSGCTTATTRSTSRRRPRWTRYFKDVPRGAREHRDASASCATSSSSSARRSCPTSRSPTGTTAESYLRARSRARGLERRFDEAHKRGEKFDGDAYRARLALELGVIQKMGFSGYFLIVWDFINWAKEHGIPVGPGRGSGAGSLVAYATAHHRHRSDRRTSCCSSAS